MSRSYKKHPAGSTHVSEKEDKRILNRSMRRSSKQLIDKYAETDEDLILPIKDEVLSRWDMAKDGRRWWDTYGEWAASWLFWGGEEKTYWDYYKAYLMK